MPHQPSSTTTSCTAPRAQTWRYRRLGGKAPSASVNCRGDLAIVINACHLTSRAAFDLVAAGQALAVYQVSGVVTRPIWGWAADRFVPARTLLAAQGVSMCVASILAGRFAPEWPPALVFAVCAVAGATASGFTGLAYAEWARLGGARRTEATGLGTGFMFAGVLVMPSAFAVAI